MLFLICLFLIFNISLYEAQLQMESGFFNSGRFRVNWTDFQTFTQFELRTDITDVNNLYTAIGFSRDRSMGDDNVVYCTYSYATAPSNGVYQGYNMPQKPNQRPILLSQSIPSVGITNSFVRLENGKLICSFQRAKSYSGINNYFDLGLNNYYLLLATGKVDNNNLIQFHASNALASDSVINFRLNSLNSGSPKPMEKLKAHACLMVIAWMFFAFTGILFARYYKYLLPSVKLFNSEFWFNIHRPFMILVVLMSITAFIVILADLDWKWVARSGSINFIHSIFGIVTIGLAIIQMLIALCRPDKLSPMRGMFNMIHRIVGLATFILSIATIFLGVFLRRANLGINGWGIMIGWTSWVIILPLLLEFTTCVCVNRRVGWFKERDKSMIRLNKENVIKFDIIKTILLFFHLIVALAFTIALVVLIARANPPETEMQTNTVADSAMLSLNPS